MHHPTALNSDYSCLPPNTPQLLIPIRHRPDYRGTFHGGVQQGRHIPDSFASRGVQTSNTVDNSIVSSFTKDTHTRILNNTVDSYTNWFWGLVVFLVFVTAFLEL